MIFNRFLLIAGVFLLLSGTLAPLSAVALKGTGLPLPRFISLRADEVNLRTGPGMQYPVEWVFHRKHLPVEVIAEFNTWRKIRDWQGTQGWVHQSVLGNRRTVIITKAVRTLRRKADSKSSTVARAEPGVIGNLIECPGGSGWCRVEIDGFEGWLRKVEFWGVNKKEVVE